MNKGSGGLEGFLRRKGCGRKAAFMPYVTAGHPSPGVMPAVFRMLRDAGADCLELGVPFSDPVADGVVIQESTQRALAAGVTLSSSLKMAALASKAGLRVLLMGYSNPFLRAGLGPLAVRMASAGVQGLIVPDLPLEESGRWRGILASRGISLPLFAAPTTPEKRLREIARRSSGFIYYVSVTGVTGERSALPSVLAARLKWMRQRLDRPVCVGFGVSTPAQAARMARLADGVIVGSALVRRLAGWTESAEKRSRIARWTAAMARAAHGL